MKISNFLSMLISVAVKNSRSINKIPNVSSKVILAGCADLCFGEYWLSVTAKHLD